VSAADAVDKRIQPLLDILAFHSPATPCEGQILDDLNAWLDRNDAAVAETAVTDAIAFLHTTPAVTITGKGGAVQRLRERAAAAEKRFDTGL